MLLFEVPPASKLLAVSLAGCGSFRSSSELTFVVQGPLDGRNHSYAVYDRDSRLLNSPIDNLSREIERRERTGGQISDVYVLAHGWNFTMEESARLYEDYRHLLNEKGEALGRQAQDVGCSFDPYYIFVVWSSVTRPMSDGLESLSPFELPKMITGTIRAFDEVAFHLLSNWGESQDAAKVGIGREAHRTFDPVSYAPEISRYTETRRQHHLNHGHTAPFQGYPLPVSTILEELLRMKARGSIGAVHAGGHSFGAKLRSPSANGRSRSSSTSPRVSPGECSTRA